MECALVGRSIRGGSFDFSDHLRYEFCIFFLGEPSVDYSTDFFGRVDREASDQPKPSCFEAQTPKTKYWDNIASASTDGPDLHFRLHWRLKT
uniref:Uncharacterized protein n=1 Tax=Steinernema glaseri TaxID=37863 RepID=A0A1I7YVG5_9BILA